MTFVRTPSSIRPRRMPRSIPPRPVPRPSLGCVVIRRITDDAGRAWRVREFRSRTGIGLFFRCDIPGIRAETRAAVASLESMSEDRLVELLQNASE